MVCCNICGNNFTQKFNLNKHLTERRCKGDLLECNDLLSYKYLTLTMLEVNNMPFKKKNFKKIINLNSLEYFVYVLIIRCQGKAS